MVMLYSYQPATPYQNQKKPRQHEAEMIENVLNHKTDVKNT